MITKEEMPIGWTLTTLGQITDIYSGTGFPKSLQGRTTGDYPFYKVGDISKTIKTGSYLMREADNYISKKDLIKLKGNTLPSKSIVFAKIGEAIKLNRRAILTHESMVDNNVMGIKSILDDSACFLYYFLLTIKLADISRATTVPSIRKSDVETINVPLPPLNEQKRIVAKIEQLFSDLDAGVVTFEAIKKQVKQYRQSVLKYAFEGKLTADWRKKNKPEPARKLLEEIAKEKEQKTKVKKQENLPSLDKSNLPELPHGWEWIGLGYLSESMKNGIYKPKQFYSDDGIACLRMYNIDKGKIVWKDIKRMILTKEEFQEYGLNPNDILINRVNSRELVGKAAVIPDTLEKCVYESKNIRLRLISTRLYSRYIGYWFLFFAHQYFTMNAQQVVGMASINQDQIGAMPIPLMDSLEQEEIVEVIEHHFSIADKIEEVVDTTLKQSTRLRQSILKRAFEGRLVHQDPNDEPAEKLIERISKPTMKVNNHK